MFKSLLGHVRGNAVAYTTLLLVVTLAPTSAYATARLTVRSADIVDGQVKNPDIALDAVTTGRIKNGQVTRSDLASSSVDSAKVANETLSGADVMESTLGEVPTALQGGLGRYGFSGSCDPESATFVVCSTVEMTLDKPGRLLVIGTVSASSEVDSNEYIGQCRIATSTDGPVLASTDKVQSNDGGSVAGDQSENMTVMAVTSVGLAGWKQVRLECNQGPTGAIEYEQARLTVVALSAG